MKNIVFLVKNGIGFGHIRRALLLAEELALSNSDLRPIVVSQAHSLDLYRASRVRVVNFPLLHRVPSARTEDSYLEMLDRLMVRLQPAVVVEDTYPDGRYGAVPSLRHVPRILIMRRLDGLSLDQLRESGAFERYMRILIAQEQMDFLSEGHSGDTLTAAELSDRVDFIGNIHHVPTPDEINRARATYSPDGEQIVVVAAGAGGDQLHDGYGDQLFGNCVQVANEFAGEGHAARFVLVTGPYYAGRPLRDTRNVVVQRFEPQLSALLAAADVAVIKPGNNALSEALVGSANLVLVPDASFMEGVDEHALRTTHRYGGVVVRPEKHVLEEAIRGALAAPARTKRPAASTDSLGQAVAIIRELATAPAPSPNPKQLALLVQGTDGIRVASIASPMTEWQTITLADAPSPATAVLLGADPPGCDPQALVDRGVRVLLVDRDGPSAGAKRWLTLSPPAPSLVVLRTAVVMPTRDEIDEAIHCVARHLRRRAWGAVRLDVRGQREDEVGTYVDKLLDWISEQSVDITDVGTLAAHAADELMGWTS
jgi:predicted glycosyltransferase